ncbi:Tyrosine--tRNA ligase, mitochondrial [Frankliniella fusca]|uniref:Tyrosine--tRNA ligase n=1 Tax=Frankliniella fusca TaxID=407009 RepID=A0AAE1HZJ3_9NEOP|nr:Tyrosine--tRNA ligase, mitochondrial [Frankliniella fusca]
MIRAVAFSRPVARLVCRRWNSSSPQSVLNLHERGMFKDIFPGQAATEIDTLLKSSSQCVYAGFDPTADSLHVGNLLVLVNLLHWQARGHQVIALASIFYLNISLGGATGHIGDPSERNTERPLMKSHQVFKNADGIKRNIECVFENFRKHFSEGAKLHPVMIVNNYDWYKQMNAVEFVGYVGRHFRMGTMLGRDSVSQRLASSGMSFTEFTYQIFQAYDWLHLLRKNNCRFQIGGSDQMGNIVSGHELISRVEEKQVYGITLPLIKSEAGDKFGKSAGNAVWLSESKTSYYDLYQFFVRTPDADVEQLLKLFTFRKLGHIKDLMKKHKDDPSKWLAQKALAEDVTTLVHGEEGLRIAKLASSILHGSDIQALSLVSAEEMKQIFMGTPCHELILTPGMTFLEVSRKAACFPTDIDARRIISAGGFSVNYQKLSNPDEVFSARHILPNKYSLLRVGKRNHFLVHWI